MRSYSKNNFKLFKNKKNTIENNLFCQLSCIILYPLHPIFFSQDAEADKSRGKIESFFSWILTCLETRIANDKENLKDKWTWINHNLFFSVSLKKVC